MHIIIIIYHHQYWHKAWIIHTCILSLDTHFTVSTYTTTVPLYNTVCTYTCTSNLYISYHYTLCIHVLIVNTFVQSHIHTHTIVHAIRPLYMLYIYCIYIHLIYCTHTLSTYLVWTVEGLGWVGEGSSNSLPNSDFALQPWIKTELCCLLNTSKNQSWKGGL